MGKRSLRREIEAWIWTIVVVFFIRAFFIQGYVVPSGSMEDTLLPGEFVLALKFTYGLEIPYTGVKLFQFKKPKRGEMVIFHLPQEGRDFVKRVVALEGDTVQIVNKTLLVNGKPLKTPEFHKDPKVIRSPLIVGENISQEDYQLLWERGKFRDVSYIRDNFGPVVVPKGCVFVMGDNRDFSWDSRYWGPLPMRFLKGNPLIIYFSWDPSGPWWKVWERVRWRRMFKILIWE